LFHAQEPAIRTILLKHTKQTLCIKLLHTITSLGFCSSRSPQTVFHSKSQKSFIKHDYKWNSFTLKILANVYFGVKSFKARNIAIRVVSTFLFLFTFWYRYIIMWTCAAKHNNLVISPLEAWSTPQPHLTFEIMSDIHKIHVAHQPYFAILHSAHKTLLVESIKRICIFDSAQYSKQSHTMNVYTYFRRIPLGLRFYFDYFVSISLWQ